MLPCAVVVGANILLRLSLDLSLLRQRQRAESVKKVVVWSDGKGDVAESQVKSWFFGEKYGSRTINCLIRKKGTELLSCLFLLQMMMFENILNLW